MPRRKKPPGKKEPQGPGPSDQTQKSQRSRRHHENARVDLRIGTTSTVIPAQTGIQCRFRIRPNEAGGNGDATSDPRHGFSFSIRHMLFWMLAAVPILTLGQRLSPFDLGYLDLITWFRLLFVAACLSVVPLLVVVTVFADRRYVWPMIPLCILLTGAIGGLLTLIVDRSWVAPPALRRTWQDWLLADLTEIGSSWIIWTLLSAAFLAGLLLLFRTSGYRLKR